jgi:hypothetical protein
MTNISRTGASKKSKMRSKYYIGICELHHELLHGFNENSSPQIKGHYLLMEKFNNFHKYIVNDVYNCRYDEIDDEDDPDLDNSDNSNSSIVDSDDEIENDNPKLIDLYRYKYSILLKSSTFMNSCHSVIRNYKNIIKSFNYIQPHIVECVYLSDPGGECVAILKTFWLKIIQRTWKRVYKQRMSVLCSVPMMRMREIRGGNSCFQYEKIHIPGLRGMLNGLMG